MDPFLSRLQKAHSLCPGCPSPKVINRFFGEVLGLMFPEHANEVLKDKDSLQVKFSGLRLQLSDILKKNVALHKADGEALASEFFDKLEKEVYDKLHEDLDAMYKGDPAAKSKTEIIRCYPGFYAISAYRVAHLLHRLGVALIPRMITEYAHSKTGVDIHPGASIGRFFCIDHATGIVIGETTIVGDRVKIYQGVTLGALSVKKEDADKKRHPTIENDVVIYAGATILGGDTVIGEGSVVGGNVWLTKSIPAKSKIYYQTKLLDDASNLTDFYVLKSEA
ncbi:serine O-acetyltransferase [Cyclobacterium marinum]|uniref:Serine O-acetyltransferase n=1 Tax=Cyclobacterium marinum (strain ATCC 25205 / DSM 745 / LMG 13164 / NCIMB 1802) TaxID=880070 RepID=G0IXD6_CYCMS|nr:serine acetyltransferase [Cyclobacterium marinum]AEL26361.1 serine O-acetyltransferase [Cyclobacterium marinum DSM 745]MBI0399703.1 serine acetyltransferase [Cyclobacterium marinum]